MKRYGLQLRMVVLAVMVWLVYSNSLQNDFHFDDFHVITDNPAVRGISDIPSFFLDPTTFSLLPGNRDYRPVFLTSMALSWQAGAGSTFPFHLTSVTIHMCNVLVLFLLIRMFLFTEGGMGNGFSDKTKEWAAWVGAGIFALHPLATESVNYISSQSVLLAAFFYLLCFYLFLTVYWHADSRSKLNLWARRIGCYGTYLLAFFSKPIVITLLANLLLWEFLLGKDPVKQDPTGSFFARMCDRLRKHMPFWGITLFALVVRQAVLDKPFASPARGIIPHYLTQTKALVFYYLKYAIYPAGLNADPEFTVSNSLFETKVVFAFLVLLAIAFFLFRMRKQRALVFWALWFPTALLVTTYLGILPQLVNEHRVYISLAGFSTVAGLFFAWLGQVFPFRISDFSIGVRSGKTLVALLVIIICGVLALNTRARNKVWASDLTLWEDAALNGGTWRAHMNYGLALEDAGRSDEAFTQLKVAVEMFPGAYSHINLGLAFIRKNNHEKGITHLRQAVSLWPDLPEGHLYLAYGLQQRGHFIEAEKEFYEAIRLRPNYIKGYRLFAEFYQSQGKPEKAVAAYWKLLEVDPTQSWVQSRIQRLAAEQSTEISFDRGFTLVIAGDYAGAVSLLTEAYPQYSKDPDLLFNLAFSYQKLGNRTEAIRYYEALLTISPKHVKGNFNLAYAHMEGDSQSVLSRSAALFRKVLELDPAYSEALFRLATVYWKLGDEAAARSFDERYLEQGVHEDLKQKSRSRLAGRLNKQR